MHDTQTQMYQNLNSREVPAFPDYSSLDKYHDTESRVAQEGEQTRDRRMDELLGDSLWNPVLKSAMASILVGGETVGLLYGANEGHVNGKVTFGSSVLDDVPLLEYRPGVRDSSLLPVVVENTGVLSNNSRPDFYVGSEGANSTLPATRYRYDLYLNDDGTVNEWGEKILETGEGRATYIGFDRLESGQEVRDAFQIKGKDKVNLLDPEDGSWSDGRIRSEFDTLQLFDHQGQPQVRVPGMFGDTREDLPEPITEAYPEFGQGGKAQLHADGQTLKYDHSEVLPESSTQPVSSEKSTSSSEAGSGTVLYDAKQNDVLLLEYKPGDAEAYPEGIAFRATKKEQGEFKLSTLKDHLAEFDGYDKKNKNVSGAHNSDSFMALFDSNSEGLNFVSETPLGHGIYQIEYQLPKRANNKAEAKKYGVEVGDIYGHKATMKKIVYDPKVWSNEAMLDMAQQAAAKEFEYHKALYLKEPDNNNQYSSTVNGVNFQVYLEKDEHGWVYVSNVHPQK